VAHFSQRVSRRIEHKKVDTNMNRSDVLNPYEHEGRFRPEAMPVEYYGIGVELAPKTVESLVTWDVSGHAQCEKDRLAFAYRSRRTWGGY